MSKPLYHTLFSKKIKPFLLAGAGILSAFALAPYYILPFMLIGMGYLFHSLNTATSKKQAFLYAFIYGFAFGAVSMGWLSNALMIDSGTFVALIPLVWIGMGLFFGIFYAVPAVLALFAVPGVRRLLAFAGWFVIFEWIRSWFLTGFPWNLVGSIWNTSLPLLQSASVWGVYGLSLITILAFCAAGLLPKKKPLIIMGSILIVLYICGLWRLYDAVPENVWGVKLRLVQPNIAQTLKWNPDKAEENYSKLIRLSKENNDAITHVIWPESAVPFLVDHNESERVRMMSAVRQGGTLITGGLRGANPTNQELANSIFVLDDMANIIGYYDKAHLVPFGEYVPLRGILPIDKLVPIGSDFLSGIGIQTIRIPKAPPASPLVCYEIIFSGQVVEKSRRPGWLINVSNDGWYGLSAGPYQHFDMAVMRAVEEGLPVVRGTNNGISAVIDPYGQIVASLDLGQEGVVDSELPRALPATPFAKMGIVFPLILAGLCIAFSIKRRK